MTEQVQVGKNITRWTFTNGSHVVYAMKDIESIWYTWVKYVNKGDTATTTCGKAKTEKGMRRQIVKALTA